MTANTQSRMNVVLTLMIPAVGLAYMTSGASVTSNPAAIGGLVALGVLWLIATVAHNTIDWPRRVVVSRARELAKYRGQRRPAMSPDYPDYVVDVGRPTIPWRWTSILLLPVELLALAWSVPFLILLIMVPIGFAVATALWVGRRIFGL